MIQHHAFNTAGNARIKMIDLETNRVEIVDYAVGAERFERHPERWCPAGMTVEEYAAALAARKAA
jgi:hypothetical protein